MNERRLLCYWIIGLLYLSVGDRVQGQVADGRGTDLRKPEVRSSPLGVEVRGTESRDTEVLGNGWRVLPGGGIQLPDGFIASTYEEAVHVSVYEAVNRGVVNISTRSIRRHYC
jgi:hypothetical protein